MFFLLALLVPIVNSPLCSGHDNSIFHALWNEQSGCHYDHEHGENPFTQQVNDTFPGFDLQGLLGGVQVGHTNPSSPMENDHKHGGFKWQVNIPTVNGCATGFEGAQTGIDAVVIQYHAFGDYSVEFESRVHSVVALIRQCKLTNPTDYGYAYIVQHVDYGQRISPYQGSILPYPDTPNPAYAAGLSPYLSVDCFGTGLPNCRESREFILSQNANASSTWTSKVRLNKNGISNVNGSLLLAILFRVRDNYQVLDSADLSYPFTYSWLCSGDNGSTYAPGCRYNNTTTRVHEIGGTIPVTWDNLSGFDTNPTTGRITADGYVTRFGNLNLSCTALGEDCHPIKLVNAFVGSYGTSLLPLKIPAFSTQALPERDICFDSSGTIISCDLVGAISSGWVGKNN